MPGRWRRRRNPNWPHLCRFPSPPPNYTQAASDVPTERVEQESVVKSEEEDTGVVFSTRGSSFGEGEEEGHDHCDEEENDEGVREDDGSVAGESQTADVLFEILRHSNSRATVFDTPLANVRRAEDAARGRGLHFGTVHRPRRARTDPSSSAVKRAHSWWMVVGQDGEAVNDMVASLSNERMPGHIGPDSELAYTPRVASHLDLVITGAVGGVITVFALAWLTSC